MRQVVSELATPLGIALLLACAAAVCRGFGRRRVSFWLVIVAAGVSYLGAIVPVGDALLGPLERRYPPLASESMPQVADVVVLGSGYLPRNGIPVTAALDDDGMARIVEGIRLVRRLHIPRLVVSGGAAKGGDPPAIGYALLARELGIPGESVTVLDTPRNTAAEAVAIVALLGDSPFILVTSAYHMPRAVQLLEALGGRPVPAPTGQRVGALAHWGWKSWLPSSNGLQKTERAWHEYLGLLAMSLDLH